MSKVYFEKVTKEFVNLSIGLRSPDLYEYTSKGIMKVPGVFKNEVKMYLQHQIERRMLSESIDKDKYIEKSVKTFVNGGKYENM